MVAQNKRRIIIKTPYIREHLEWKPIAGFENQYEVSNYGDFHILPYEFIDKANRKIKRKEKYIWSEELSEYGGDKEQGRYLGVHLGGMKKTYAHIIAAKAFCPNPHNKPEVNHKNGNTKYNYCGCQENKYEDTNLEWVTRKENMEHASANGLINHESYLRKLQCKKNREKVDYDAIKRPVIQLTTQGEYVQEFPSIVEASQITGIGKSTIDAVARHEGYHKTAGGYNWIYKDEYDSTKDYIVNIDLGSGNRRAVAQCDMDWNIINTYSSPMEAERLNKENNFSNKYIRDCAHGKRKTHKGFKWKFID